MARPLSGRLWIVLFVLAMIGILAGCGDSKMSSNWAGHCSSASGLTGVSSSWVQPFAFPSGGGEATASFWVGLDGQNDHVVEQIGTEADTSGRSVTYSAWFEMFPAPPQSVDMAVHAGDVMDAAVSRDGLHLFTLTLIDETTGASFATTQFAAYKAPASSAEIVAEAPSEKGIGFADFDSVHFGRCAFNSRPINAFGPARLNIVHHYDYAQTSTSRLDAGGASFSVTQIATVASSNGRILLAGPVALTDAKRQPASAAWQEGPR